MFTIAKIVQLILYHWSTRTAATSKKSDNRISYKPSLQAAVTMVNLIAMGNTDSNVEDNLVINLASNKFEFFSLDSNLIKTGLIDNYIFSSIDDRPLWDSDSSIIFLPDANFNSASSSFSCS